MSLVSASAKRVGNGGFGTLGSLIPAESFFFDDVDSTSSVYRAEIISQTNHGTLFAYNDGKFTYTGDGSNDSFSYTLYKDGVSVDSYTVTLGDDIVGSNIDVSSTFGSLTSGLSLTATPPEYNVSVSSSFSSLQSAISVLTGVPEYTIGIASSFSGLTTSVSITNQVPEYSLNVTSSFGQLQSEIEASFGASIPDITIASTFGNLISTIAIESIVPEFNISVGSSFQSLSGSVNIVIGELVRTIPSKNLVSVKIKSNYTKIRI